MLDLIEDPQNFGAILRIADAAGVHAVIYKKNKD
ncbi:TrmH family RNA methyltransferase [Thermodesulfovibrio yellowstonii]